MFLNRKKNDGCFKDFDSFLIIFFFGIVSAEIGRYKEVTL